MNLKTTLNKSVINLKTPEAKFIDIFRSPIVTEKAYKLQKNRQYSFLLDRKSDKSLIKTAIEYLFKVKVESVNTMILPIKTSRRKGLKGHFAQYKKAIVKLAPGFTLEFSEIEKTTLGI